MLFFHKIHNNGLKDLKIEKFNIPKFDSKVLPNAELLCLYGKSFHNSCDWNGFMSDLTDHLPYVTSRIIHLPFLNHFPTDPNTILTTLSYALGIAKKIKLHVIFVTFDQTKKNQTKTQWKLWNRLHLKSLMKYS